MDKVRCNGCGNLFGKDEVRILVDGVFCADECFGDKLTKRPVLFRFDFTWLELRIIMDALNGDLNDLESMEWAEMILGDIISKVREVIRGVQDSD